MHLKHYFPEMFLEVLTMGQNNSRFWVSVTPRSIGSLAVNSSGLFQDIKISRFFFQQITLVGVSIANSLVPLYKIAHTVIDKYTQITQNSTTIYNILSLNLPPSLLYLETKVRIKLKVRIPNYLQLS